MRNDEIQELYETRSISLRSVAKQFGLTHERIRQILTKRGVRMNPPKALRQHD